MTSEIPTLEEFQRVCRERFRFLIEDFGFLEVPCMDEEHFCVRFTNEDRSLEIRGEGYGTRATSFLSYEGTGALAFIYLVPEASRPKRSRNRDRMGQLEQVRECAQLARE